MTFQTAKLCLGLGHGDAPLKPPSDKPDGEECPVDQRLRAAFGRVEAAPLPDSIKRLIDLPQAPDRARDRRS